MNLNAWYSHKSDNWATPSNIYKYFKTRGYFDPCPLNSTFNGLEIEWEEYNFVNPPYSRLKEWVIKCIKEHSHFRKVVMLIPARTDTQAFKLLYDYGARFTFITGRLAYNDIGTAPFPSMLVALTGQKSTIDRIDRDQYDLY